MDSQWWVMPSVAVAVIVTTLTAGAYTYRAQAPVPPVAPTPAIPEAAAPPPPVRPPAPAPSPTAPGLIPEVAANAGRLTLMGGVEGVQLRAISGVEITLNAGNNQVPAGDYAVSAPFDGQRVQTGRIRIRPREQAVLRCVAKMRLCRVSNR